MTAHVHNLVDKVAALAAAVRAQRLIMRATAAQLQEAIAELEAAADGTTPEARVH